MSLAQRHAQTLAVFTPVALINVLLLWSFHDRHWYPSDEGIFATIASRVLSGEAMNLDVQNFHPGYGDFINVAAFRFFGVNLLSLRYPLVLAAFVQSCLVFRLLERRSLLLAASGSITVTSIGVIQFLNPTPHWYALCLTTGLACWLVEVPRAHWVRLVGAGLFIGTITLLRQLTGVFVAMAVVVVALGEASAAARARDTWLTRGILAMLLFLLVGYLTFSRGVDAGGLVLFAAWPLAMLVLALKETRTPNRQAVTIVAQLAVGAVVSALPLLWYCLKYGSLGSWLDDTVLAALSLPRLDIFLDAGAWYGALPFAGLYQAVTASAPTDVPGGLYLDSAAAAGARQRHDGARAAPGRTPGAGPAPGRRRLLCTRGAVHAERDLPVLHGWTESDGRVLAQRSSNPRAPGGMRGNRAVALGGRRGLPRGAAHQPLECRPAARTGHGHRSVCRILCAGRTSPEPDRADAVPTAGRRDSSDNTRGCGHFRGAKRRRVVLPDRTPQSVPLLQHGPWNTRRRGPRAGNDPADARSTRCGDVSTGRQIQHLGVARHHRGRAVSLRPNRGSWRGRGVRIRPSLAP